MHSKANNPFQSLSFLKQEAKITMDHNSSFQNCYLNHTPEGGFQCVVFCNNRSKCVDFSILLPDFIQQWTIFVVDHIFFPDGRSVFNFLKQSTSNNVPLANVDSANSLLQAYSLTCLNRNVILFDDFV